MNESHIFCVNNIKIGIFVLLGQLLQIGYECPRLNDHVTFKKAEMSKGVTNPKSHIFCVNTMKIGTFALQRQQIQTGNEHPRLHETVTGV